MLCKFYKENSKFINIFNKVIDSKLFMFFIVLLGLLSNLFGIELIVYTIYALIVCLVSLFGKNFIANLPMAVIGYMTFSKENNPRGPDNTSIFFEKDVQIYFICICVFIGIFALSRMIHDLIYYKERRKFPKLGLGFIILGFSFIHGGAYTEEYEFRTSLFGLLEIIALSFSYFIFYYTSDFKKINKEYWAELFTMVSMMMVIEMGYVLIEGGVFDLSIPLERKKLWTGWGHHNNMGGIILMCMPAPFYLSLVKKNGWIYCILGNFATLSCALSMSRNALLFGFIIYLVMFILVVKYSKGKERVNNLLVYLSCFTITAVCITIFNDTVYNLLYETISRGFKSSGRIELYRKAIEEFKSSPLFGKGFYNNEIGQWGEYNPDSFLPGRYHNTIFQLLASTGLLGIFAYIYHRYETIKLVFNKFNLSKLFIFISILSFLASSLFDCFFFNFGPGLLYSALLLLLEKDNDLESA